jgi:hypothetical protein
LLVELKVWVGCLACYNGGTLTGEWLDAADAESYRCPKAPVAHEELWVMDTDGMPVSQEMSPMEAVAWADLMDRAASAYVDVDVVVAWIRYHGVTDPDAVDLAEIEDTQAGTADSDEDFAREVWVETRGSDPETVWPYGCIDWAWAARELMFDYYSERYNGTSYYFQNPTS